jgi:hypothetical protein
MEAGMWVFVFLMSVFVVQSTAVRSDEYKDISDAAYCIGVVSKNYDLKKIEFGGVTDEGLKQYQIQLARFTAIVEDAIKRNKFDKETSNKLVSVGEQETKVCWENVMKCSQDGLKRTLDHVEKNEAERLNGICERATVTVCRRAMACE